MTPLCVGCETQVGCVLANWGMAIALLLIGVLFALAAAAFVIIANDRDDKTPWQRSNRRGTEGHQ